jgi:hypothetical protein
MRFTTSLAALLIVAAYARAQEKPEPAVTVDLKPLGASPDLFSDSGDSKNQQRGVINVFWLGVDRVAVAFSTNRRWSGANKPGPLHIRLLIFQLIGEHSLKQQQSREWDFGAEGPEASITLDLTPGPDDSILAIHKSNSAGKIPDGDFVQVLNSDTSPRQDFYVPATSAWVPSILPEPGLVLETYYANKHSSLAWWSGKPLKPGPTLDLPLGNEETLAGPAGIAAQADCGNPTYCFGVRVYFPETTRPAKAAWYYSLPEPETVPLPRVFLSPTALVVELRHLDQKQSDLVLIHPDGTHTPLPAIPHGSQMVGATGVSSDGRRFALTAAGEVGICGLFEIWCNQRDQALVIDVPSKRVVFQQEISAAGGTSSLSADGKHFAVFDRDKLAVYLLP